MSDILVQKPQAGQVVTLAPQAEDRLVLEFNTNDALLTRAEDNLIFSFDDGSRIEMQDFYVAYTSENMPTFIIDNAVVDGQSFFAALGEELMPAAGNQSSPQGSGTGVGLEGGSLLAGVDRLGRTDQERTSSEQDNDNLAPTQSNPEGLEDDGSNDDTGSSAPAPDTTFGDGTENLSGAVISADYARVAGKEINTIELPAGTTFAGGATSFVVNTEDGRAIGTFEIVGDKLIFTQDAAFDHTGLASDFTGKVQLPLVDTDGNTGTANVDITIMDSAPDLKGSTQGVSVSDLSATVSGHFTYSKGDDVDNLIISGITVGDKTIPLTDDSMSLSEDGKTLTAYDASKNELFTLELTDNNDGTATWELSRNGKFYDDVSFEASMIDQDGDKSSTSLNIINAWGDMNYYHQHSSNEYQINDNEKMAKNPDEDYIVIANNVGANHWDSKITTQNGDDVVSIDGKILLGSSGKLNGPTGNRISATIDTNAGNDFLDVNGGGAGAIPADAAIENRYNSSHHDPVYNGIRALMDIKMGAGSDIVDVEAASNNIVLSTTDTFQKKLIVDSQYITRIDGGEDNDSINLTGQHAIVVNATHNTNFATNIIEGGTGSDAISITGSIIATGEGQARNIINGDSGEINGYNDYTAHKDTAENHDILGLTNTVDGNNINFAASNDGETLHMVLPGQTGNNVKAEISNIEEFRFGWEHDGKDWTIATDETDDYNINFANVGSNYKGSDLTIRTADGDDTITGSSNDDIIFGGGGNDVLKGGIGNDVLNGGAGDDLMIDNVFNDVDGGEGMDVLLVNVQDLIWTPENEMKDKLSEVKEKLDNGDITDTEVIVVGNVNGASTEEVFNKLDISTNKDGQIELGEGWSAGKAYNESFTEFTNKDDSVTILVETMKLDTGV